MRISALIPTYNRCKYVLRAIESVLSQTVPVDEIIVVDDGSTDGTAEEIERRFGDRVRVVRQQNQGVSVARRRGILEAQGEWIAFLDSDDEWFPDRTRQLAMAAEQLPPEVAWLFADMRILTDEGEGKTFFERYGLPLAQLEIFSDPFSVQFPFQFPMLQSSLIRRKVLVEAECFTAGLRSDDDLLVGYKIACRYKFAAIPAVVTKFYRTSDLFGTSVQHNGDGGPDYFRARMLAYALAIKTTGRKEPWAAHYAPMVRGLCKLRVVQGKGCRRLAMEQFRYGLSAKSVAFACAAILGRPALRTWEVIATAVRRIRGRRQYDAPFALEPVKGNEDKQRSSDTIS